METEILIKLGEYQHMKELLEDGVVFMNTLEYYRTLEHDDERKDANEGAERIRNLAGGTLRMKDPATGMFKDAAMLTHSTIRELNSNLRYLNVYCLYYCKARLPVADLGALVGDRVRSGFGQYAVVVADPASFVTRVKAAAEAKGYRHLRNLVEYADLTRDEAEVGPFIKHLSYAHQQELRIAVHTGNVVRGPIKLEVGDIRDIAALIPAGSLNEVSIAEHGG